MDTKVENVGSVSENRKKSAATLEDHYLRKRQPQKIETGKEIIYVSTKSSLQALQAKCEKLINSDENEIIIHCLGAAIPQGILLALKICDKYPTFKSAVNTLTSELTDDLEPATDEADYEIQKRLNSALRIKVFRTDFNKLTATS